MTKKRRWVLFFILAVLIVFSGVANASLITIGTANYLGSDYNLIYENDQGLVWLDYTRNATIWQSQVDWASGLGGSLTVTLDPLYKTTIDWSTGWRLPVTDESVINMSGGFGYQGPDGSGNYNYLNGYNMVNSEMGHLYYQSLMNKGFYATDGTSPQPGWGLQNEGPFNNLGKWSPGSYWSGTEYSPSTGLAWIFSFRTGIQVAQAKGPDGYYAMAVRPGDVTPVPEPATILLLGSGLIGLAGWGRRNFYNHV